MISRKMFMSYDFYKSDKRKLKINRTRKMRKPKAEIKKINSKGIFYSIQ